MKIEEIARLIDGRLEGDGAGEIFRAASLDAARENEISFVEKVEKTELAAATRAACLIVPESFSTEISLPVIRVKNPKLAFAKIVEKLHPFKRRAGWHDSAIISQTSDVRAGFIGAFVSIGENSRIGEDVQIYDGVKIGSSVKIGKSAIIHPNCVIYDNVSIGNDCVIHAGAVIGADGFGYVRDGANGYEKFPQIGSVEIGDNVEIGANTCIDRGSLGATRIGKGTKIDNLVQIAHNVRIGENVIIAAMTGLSGSVEIGDDVVLAGQVGISDHVRVETGATIGAKSAVFPNKIIRRGVWAGVPAVPLAQYKRQNAMVNGLARLREEVKELKRQIDNLRNEDSTKNNSVKLI